MRIGTHNSASYLVNWNISFWGWTSKWEWFRLIAKWIPPIRRLIEGYVCTQSASILEQLQYGVDILDLRVSYANGKYYLSHTFCCAGYADVLAQIYAYIYMFKPSYTIHILISPDSNNSTMAHRERNFINLTTEWFRTYLSEGKIVIYYAPINIDISDMQLISNLSAINKYWFNVDSISEFIKKYNSIEFTTLADFGLDCVLTPSRPKCMSSAIKFLFTDSIRKYADIINPAVIALFKSVIICKEIESIIELEPNLEYNLKRMPAIGAKNKGLPQFCMFDYISKEFVAKYNAIRMPIKDISAPLNKSFDMTTDTAA